MLAEPPNCVDRAAGLLSQHAPGGLVDAPVARSGPLSSALRSPSYSFRGDLTAPSDHADADEILAHAHHVARRSCLRAAPRRDSPKPTTAAREQGPGARREQEARVRFLARSLP